MAYMFFQGREAKARAAGAMGRAASAVGAAATKFSKNLASVKVESWKSGAEMMGSLRDIDWDKGTKFFGTFRSFFEQFGIFSELLKPLIDMFEIMDATIIQENTEEIIAWNKTVQDATKVMQDGIRAFKDFEEAGGRMYNSFTLLRHSIEFLINIVEDLANAILNLPSVPGRGGRGGGGGGSNILDETIERIRSELPGRRR